MNIKFFILFLAALNIFPVWADGSDINSSSHNVHGKGNTSDEISPEEINSEISILERELSDLESRKIKLGKISLILGFSTVLGMSSSAYCAWQAIDNFNSYNTVSYPELALEYKTRARNYTTAGIFSSGISIFLGSLEVLVVINRRRIKKDILKIDRMIEERRTKLMEIQ